MISDIFKIRDVPANSTGVYWSVSWPGRGSVSKPENFKTIWDLAWDTKASYVSFAMDSGETYAVNDVGQDNQDYMWEHVFKVVERYGGLTGVGFAYEKEAVQFVEEAEKVITWKMLARDYG